MRCGGEGGCRLSFGLSDLGFCALYVTKEGTCTDSVALNPRNRRKRKKKSNRWRQGFWERQTSVREEEWRRRPLAFTTHKTSKLTEKEATESGRENLPHPLSPLYKAHTIFTSPLPSPRQSPFRSVLSKNNRRKK